MLYLNRRLICIWAASLLLLSGHLACAQDCLDYSDYFPDLAPNGPRINAGGSAQAVALSGSILALGTDTCIQLYDVSDPLAPIWLGEAPVRADRLLANGDLLYAAYYHYGLHTIDISDPAAPVVTEYHPNPYGTSDLVIHNGYLFVTPNLNGSVGWYGVMVFDLADPAHPVLVNEVEIGTGFSLDLRGEILFRATYDPYYGNTSNVNGIDLSDPLNPARLSGWISFSGRTRDIALHGDYLYAVTDTHGLYVIDTSDPANPFVVHQMPELVGSNSIAIVDQTAWVVVRGASDENELVSLSLANPTSPQQLNSTSFSGDELYHTTGDGWMYLATDAPGPLLVDISTPTLPVVHPWAGAPVGNVELTASGFDAANGLLYIGSEIGDPLRIVNVSDPLVPRQIASIPGTLLGRDVAVQDTLLFQLVKDKQQPANYWLDSYSVADPKNPAPLGRCDFVFTYFIVATEGAVYSTLNGQLHVVDVRDPVNPVYSHSFNLPGYGTGYDLLVNGDELYVPLASSGLLIYDISNAVDPQLASTVALGSCGAVDVSGHLAYASDSYDGLVVIDVGDPNSPVILNTIPLPETMFNILVDGSRLFVSGHYTAGRVYDISQPLTPVPEGEFRSIAPASEMELLGPWMVMNQGIQGLQFFWRDCEASVSAVQETPLPSPSIFAVPNPFNPCTTVEYSVRQSGDVEVGIFDLAGRRIALLVSGWRETGTFHVTWDGRNGQGRAMPSGSYLVRCRSADGLTCGKVALIR